MNKNVSAIELHIPELIGTVDLTDYPGMGVDLRRLGVYEGEDFILLNIVRLGKKLSPIGYLRPYPYQSLLIEVEEGWVIGFDFMNEEFYPEFIFDYVNGLVTLHASYVIVTDAGANVLWFRRFPRSFVSYLRPLDLSLHIGQDKFLDYYKVYMEKKGGLSDFIQRTGTYGCFPVSFEWRLCIDRLRVYPDGTVGSF